MLSRRQQHAGDGADKYLVRPIVPEDASALEVAFDVVVVTAPHVARNVVVTTEPVAFDIVVTAEHLAFDIVVTAPHVARNVVVTAEHLAFDVVVHSAPAAVASYVFCVQLVVVLAHGGPPLFRICGISNCYEHA
jgi:hypothetical protein